MTIIVAFILDAFVFRMNYSRKNREPLENPEGGTTFVLSHVLWGHESLVSCLPFGEMNASRCHVL